MLLCRKRYGKKQPFRQPLSYAGRLVQGIATFQQLYGSDCEEGMEAGGGMNGREEKNQKGLCQPSLGENEAGTTEKTSVGTIFVATLQNKH